MPPVAETVRVVNWVRSKAEELVVKELMEGWEWMVRERVVVPEPLRESLTKTRTVKEPVVEGEQEKEAALVVVHPDGRPV